MKGIDTTKTAELSLRMERLTDNTCPVCKDKLVALVPNEPASVYLPMLSDATSQVHQGFLFDLVMCSQCGYTRLHHHDALSEWLDTLEESDNNG